MAPFWFGAMRSRERRHGNAGEGGGKEGKKREKIAEAGDAIVAREEGKKGEKRGKKKSVCWNSGLS